MRLKKEKVTKIPLWALFYNVPLELWTAQGLSHIVSSVGRPLDMDHFTESCKRVSYAKVCVEVDIDASLPSSFDLICSNGEKVEIKIQYPWKPVHCKVCKVFGHTEGKCQLSGLHDGDQGGAKPPLGRNNGKAAEVWQRVAPKHVQRV